MDDIKIKKPESIKSLAFSVAVYSSFSIFGPLFVFGGIGLVFYKIFDSKLILFISILIAFVMTNILIARKIKKMIKKMEEVGVKDDNKQKK